MASNIHDILPALNPLYRYTYLDIEESVEELPNISPARQVHFEHHEEEQKEPPLLIKKHIKIIVPHASLYKSPELERNESLLKGVGLIALGVILATLATFTLLGAAGTLPFALPFITPLTAGALSKAASSIIGLTLGSTAVALPAIYLLFKGVKVLHQARINHKGVSIWEDTLIYTLGDPPYQITYDHQIKLYVKKRDDRSLPFNIEDIFTILSAHSISPIDRLEDESRYYQARDLARNQFITNAFSEKKELTAGEATAFIKHLIISDVEHEIRQDEERISREIADRPVGERICHFLQNLVPDFDLD